MNDLDFIVNQTENFTNAIKKRGCEVEVDLIKKLAKQQKSKATKIQDLRSEKNKIAKSFKRVTTKERDLLVNRSKEIEKEIAALKLEEEELQKRLKEILLNLPNIPDISVPDGHDENSNIEVFKFGKPKDFDFKPKAHDELGTELNLIDFKKTAEICGARFSTLKNDLAKLYRVLVNFAIEHNKSFGYQELFMPFLVREKAMYNAGQLPKFKKDSFMVEDSLRLIPTSEVTLCNFLAGERIDFKDLPIRLTCYSECFRSEAGSSGKDTKGMIRQHQFSKVELFSATTKEESDKELERMTGIVEDLLQGLELPYRKVLLCAGDLGFCAKKTYDIEVWMPSQNCYREISSCSNCGDFQARRMMSKYKNTNGKSEFLHTLNGTSIAIGRLIAAIIENYQDSKSNIEIPKILRTDFAKDKMME